MVLAVLRLITLVTAVVFLSACSGTYKSYVDMFKFALTPPQDINLSFNEILEAPNDFLYVRSGKQGRAALGLMFVEGGQFKWISASKELIVTENGRIVRTQGLPNNLLYLSNLTADPLKTDLTVAKEWVRSADWSIGEYGYKVRSSFTAVEGEKLRFFGQQIEVIKLVETLYYDNPYNYLRFDRHWQNTFWIDAKSGIVLKSYQTLAPGMEPIELVFVSDIVRQLNQSGVNVPEETL